jgi:cob(I)alamin adenosyltransferase
VKIYTRTGDAGETSLFDGTRVKKHDPRVDAYGEVDEVNAWLGLARASRLDPALDGEIVQLQRDLFALGAQLADPADKLAPRVTKAVLGDEDVVRLDELIDRLEV